MDTQSVLLALGGGLLIGLSAAGLLWLNGRIAGISNIVGGLWALRQGDQAWRLAFALGLLSGGGLLLVFVPDAFAGPYSRSLPVLAAAGLLVGLGTRLGNGCTSGHGVCGLSRRSRRSLVATLVFMSTGMITVYLFDHLLV
jgi:uncharacterized protein